MSSFQSLPLLNVAVPLSLTPFQRDVVKATCQQLGMTVPDPLTDRAIVKVAQDVRSDPARLAGWTPAMTFGEQKVMSAAGFFWKLASCDPRASQGLDRGRVLFGSQPRDVSGVPAIFRNTVVPALREIAFRQSLENAASFANQVAGIIDSFNPDPRSLEFRRRLVAGQKKFDDLDLRRLDIPGINLEGVQIVDCWMDGASFHHVNLAGARIVRTNMSGVAMPFANFAGVEMIDCNLTGAFLLYAKSPGLVMVRGSLDGAQVEKDFVIKRPELEGAPDVAQLESLLSGALPSAESAPKAERTRRKASDYTDLSDKTLPNSDFRGERFGIRSFRRAILGGSAFGDVYRSKFDGGDLRDCDFVRADARGASFVKADCRNSDFSGAMLKGADFRGADLTNAKFDGADLTDVKYDQDTNIDFSDFLGAIARSGR